jgi:hypothetical protein
MSIQPFKSPLPSPLRSKPTVGGWGFNRSYAKAWDGIKWDHADADSTAGETEAAVSHGAKRAALDAAREVGALSEALYDQAVRELGGEAR